MPSTKARLLKHDFPVRGPKNGKKQNCVTKILPIVLVRLFASKPLFHWAMTGSPSNRSENSLVLFVRFFSFVSPFGSFL